MKRLGLGAVFAFAVCASTALAGGVKKLPLGTMQAERMLTPQRMVELDRNGVPLTDWVEMGGIAGTPACFGGFAYDAAQLDSAFNPIGGTCVPNGLDSSRYYFGGAYHTDGLVEDFRVNTGVGGMDIGSGAHLMFWAPATATRLILILGVYDSFAFDCTLFNTTPRLPWSRAQWPASPLAWGVAFDYGPQTSTGGYFILGFDLCAAAPGSHLIPADGSGAYFIGYATALNTTTGDWTPANFPVNPNVGNLASPKYMVWAFNSTTPRPGQGDDNTAPLEETIWADDTVLDAGNPWNPTDECFTLPSLGGIAPACNFLFATETATSFALRGNPDPCAAFIRGDANCDQAVNNLDIDPFVLALVSANHPTPFDDYLAVFPNCDPICATDINRDAAVNNLDIDPFVACLINLACP